MPNPLEDIFGDTDPASGVSSSPPPISEPSPQAPLEKVGEVLRQDVMAEGGGTLSPHERQRPSPPPPPPPPVPLAPENPSRRSTTIRVSNRVLLWGAFVIVLVLLLGIVLWMFTGVLRQSVLEESGNENTNTVRNTNTPTVITNSSNSNANVATVNLSPLDADQDGLSAEEEARLGTDPDDSIPIMTAE